ncbi:TPA: hypothetical protein ACH3X1_016377 [Trebouxia sp. C0004]
MQSHRITFNLLLNREHEPLPLGMQYRLMDETKLQPIADFDNVTSDRRSRQQTCKGPKCSRATKNSCASNMALLTSPQQCCEEPQDKGRSQCHAFGW